MQTDTAFPPTFSVMRTGTAKTRIIVTRRRPGSVSESSNLTTLDDVETAQEIAGLLGSAWEYRRRENAEKSFRERFGDLPAPVTAALLDALTQCPTGGESIRQEIYRQQVDAVRIGQRFDYQADVRSGWETTSNATPTMTPRQAGVLHGALLINVGALGAHVNGMPVYDGEHLASLLDACRADLACEIELGNEPAPTTWVEAIMLAIALSAAPTFGDDWYEVYDHQIANDVLPEYEEDDDWPSLTRRLLGAAPGLDLSTDDKGGIVTDIPFTRWRELLPGCKRRHRPKP